MAVAMGCGSKLWARYAWNPDRDPTAEKAYWTAKLAERYGGTRGAALAESLRRFSRRAAGHSEAALARQLEPHAYCVWHHARAASEGGRRPVPASARHGPHPQVD